MQKENGCQKLNETWFNEEVEKLVNRYKCLNQYGNYYHKYYL